MNDFDLEAKLKSVPLPEYSEDHWEQFPAQVRANLRQPSMKPVSRNVWWPRLAWAGGFALMMILGIWCAQFKPLKIASATISKSKSHLHAEFAQFETKLLILMRDEHGMHHLIADKE